MWRQLHLWIVCGVHNQGRHRRYPKSMIVHVELLELNRTKARNLGFDFQNCKPGASSIFGANGSGRGFIKALKKEGIVRVLSDPTICTVSGRPVFFNCGGEFPIPVKQPDGSLSVEYRKYGTQIDCVPTIREGGNIRLEFRTRLSEIDPSHSVNVGDTQLPGLRVHEFDTAGEVKPGQAMVIVGPAESHSVLEVVHNMPWFLETASEQMEEFFETHPMAALAASWAVENLGELLYSNTVEVVARGRNSVRCDRSDGCWRPRNATGVQRRSIWL